MYQTCLFCSAKLGANDMVEHFPVGGMLAFDAWKGRLWAVCPRCRRWNLAPIEERWEAVEEADRLFRDARLRAQSENIGLAKLPDGTRLVRVGEALPREFAAWRYGDQMRRPGWLPVTPLTAIKATAAAASVTVAFGGGIPLLAAVGVPAVAAGYGLQMVMHAAVFRQMLRVVHRLPAAESPTGKEHVIRQQDAFRLKVVPNPTGEGIAVELPSPLPMRREEEGGVVRWLPPEPLLLQGYHAQRVLNRTLTATNRRPSAKVLGSALDHIDRAGGPEGALSAIASQQAGLFGLLNSAARVPDFAGGWKRFVGTFRGERIAGAPQPITRVLPRPERVALEMLLNEESERRALQGELALLQSAWREAEEIAAIADALPDGPTPQTERLNA